MYPMVSVTATEHPLVPNDINQTQMNNSYSTPFIEWVYFEHDLECPNNCFRHQFDLKSICWLVPICLIIFFSRPSLFSSSHHQHQHYSTVVNPQPPISSPNVFQWSPISSTSQNCLVQQSSFNPLNMPQSGPWKCPEWMANQTIQPGSYMNFNGQQHSRLPFKRKAAPDLDM